MPHYIKLIITMVSLVGFAVFSVGEQKPPALIDWSQACSNLTPSLHKDSRAKNPEGIDGRVLCGYQGWFRAEGDGSSLGFHHYKRAGKFEPGFCSIDLWPDMSELSEQEKFPTPFQHSDGSVAHVYSSLNKKTVSRHFKWMADFDIDGVFVQRFAHLAAKPKKDYRLVHYDNQKLMNCRDAAIQNQRCYALMYDLSGMRDADFEHLARDWKALRKKMLLGLDPNDKAYLHYNGKPLVAIWGVGFGNERAYSLKQCEFLIRLLKHNPDWGGMSIMLGVPYHWREQTKDAIKDPDLHRVLQLADVISPWSVGRYRDEAQVRTYAYNQIRGDIAWCNEHKVDYLPVLFPGFSWRNLYPEKQNTSIARNGGKFYWQQFKTAESAGARGAYIAMFDEMDEATAIFKCTNNPPVGASHFQTYEGKPSDHYLWLSQQGRNLLRGELPKRQ